MDGQAMLIDTHCHLDFEWFDEDREAVVARALAAGVTRIIVPAIDLPGCTAVLQLAERYETVYAAVGVHPNSSADWQDNWISHLHELAQHEKVVAVGEIGLDYYRDRSPKAVQQRALRQQLALAADLELPVILHNREANEDIICLLTESPLAGKGRPGVLHSFAADWPTAQAALAMGCYLGFTGPVTYKKADDLRQIVAQVPPERILVETDAPYLPPQPYRGKRNEPAYVQYIAEHIAAIQGLAAADFAQQSSANAQRLFARMS
jgi:TatD DNase family protein